MSKLEERTDLPIDAIVPNARQPRTVFEKDALLELAASIREVGVLQPVVVRQTSPGRYELIAGERRLRASKMAGLTRVPALVMEADERKSLELAIIENVQREDITPLESARAYRRLIDEFGLTQEAVAERVGKSRVAVANTVRLLRLPQRVQEGLASGVISEAHARAILQFRTEPEQLAVFEDAVAGDWTVKRIERAAQVRYSAKRTRKGQALPDAQRLALEEAFSEALGAPVRVESGRIVVEFFGEDDLARIGDLLNVRL